MYVWVNRDVHYYKQRQIWHENEIKIHLKPPVAEFFYSQLYQRQHTEIYSSIIKRSSKNLYNTEYLSNGLLEITYWESDHILFEDKYFFISKPL